jgi:hypothetical protein
MTHYHRDPPRTFAPIRSCVFPKMLVSGCSFTHNFHHKYLVTWPYYLRDLANIEHVYDVSLAGGGSQHIFNSIVYEIETNPDINPRDTMVMVMWSGLSRTDVIAETSMVEPWVRHAVPTPHRPGDTTDGIYRFDDRFSTFSIQCLDRMKRDPDPMARMQYSYKLVVGWDAQVLQSLLNIVALAGYLESKGFTWMFMSWKDPQLDLDIVPGELSQRVGKLMQTVLPLGDYALNQKQLDSSLHPTPAANMAWTESHLIPALDQLGLTNILSK